MGLYFKGEHTFRFNFFFNFFYENIIIIAENCHHHLRWISFIWCKLFSHAFYFCFKQQSTRHIRLTRKKSQATSFFSTKIVHIIVATEINRGHPEDKCVDLMKFVCQYITSLGFQSYTQQFFFLFCYHKTFFFCLIFFALNLYLTDGNGWSPMQKSL